MTWAAIASQPGKPRPQIIPATPTSTGTTAVLDASAIIAGFDRNLADNLTTVPEVLQECKDAVAKQRLQLLPEGISIEQPSPESLKRVAAFAKAVGEYQSLSAVDIHLLALTHTLELAVHGDSHLRTSPAPPRMAPKHRRGPKKLPGWGDQGGDWAQLDSLNISEDAAQDLGGPGADQASKVSSNVQQLPSTDAQNRPGSEAEQQKASAGEPATVADDAADDDSADDDSDSDDSAGSTDDKGNQDSEAWETAAKSGGAARKQRRSQRRKQAWAEHHAQQQQQQQQEASEAAALEDDSASDGDDVITEASTQDDDEARKGCVALVTGDYAMQNVCLQMGMRLVAPDGARVTRVARWAMRCAACFKVTLEQGRMFCGQCGNAALDKVEVVVGSDGMLQYGVRKRHNLRGTRYSLPKPQGGKASQPILREDVLLQRMPRVKKQADLPDAFAPEYTLKDSWLAKPGSIKGAQIDQVTAAASLGHTRRNPNERWMSRSNRRK
ncbi:hypothetical protein WJX73_007232 [Symbiochloris irregularis]|uniref:20S-pre-rRNA D-site endonuclease NOB1 n=1 Tax=Symbiochloris irregularis TaxID=706552 RepID=A0AAW1NUM6_9CHLO